MSKHLATFELLPNELLIELFRYFDAQQLFQAFYNLNSRLNKLLKSLDELKLVFYLKKSNSCFINNEQIFSDYVYTLIVDSNVNVNLSRFPNIHRLKFGWFSMKELVQLSINKLPYLTQLDLVYIASLQRNDESSCMQKIRSLKVRFINFLFYERILFECPNLDYLQFSLFTFDEFTLNTLMHINLKRLVINISDIVWPWHDNLLNGYLSCVPNIEEFTVYRSLQLSRIQESFINYDWLASIISRHLLKLTCFKFYLQTVQWKTIHTLNTEEILHRIKQSFDNAHNGPYQARLIIDFS